MTIFQPVDLAKMVGEQLKDVPLEHKVATVVVVHRDQNGNPVAQMVFAYRPAEHWQIQSYAELAKGNDVKDNYGLNYGAKVQWST